MLISLMNALEEKKMTYEYLKKTGQLDVLEEQELFLEIKTLENKLEEVTI